MMWAVNLMSLGAAKAIPSSTAAEAIIIYFSLVFY